MKIILRSGAVAAAVGVGLSLAALPSGPATAAGGTHVPCNDITALRNAITQANTSGGRIILASHCTYTLTAADNTDDGLPEITGNVTITGRDTTIRRAPAPPRTSASSTSSPAATSPSTPSPSAAAT